MFLHSSTLMGDKVILTLLGFIYLFSDYTLDATFTHLAQKPYPTSCINSARELSIMVLANSPESGKILSMRMSRFSGYRSGASTTGQRSWGKSETANIKQIHVCFTRHSYCVYMQKKQGLNNCVSIKDHTSAKCLEEGVNLLLPNPTGSLLAKQ